MISLIVGGFIGLCIAWWFWPQPEWAMQLREWIKTNLGV